ncbi:hypothetical protein TRL7639_03053 [Falsiruegeria litorea R37]|uniref:Uncharacterized protein n=1 Tax=Falsiruegeria litorea R37 TaxID=1200284 RepID=A0A1Y5T6A7_9RHOB|nr:hypothetical protein [Falsiruegeria litorea]SLN56756.1 hypothetical protein TRL7639_03053 [Falsiruegeria litorea R37]
MKDTRPPDTIPNPYTTPSQPTLRFDVNDWLPYIEDENASYEQKIELIETLWAIVIGFVDLGWDIKSVNESCGEDADLYTLLTSGMVDLENAQTDQTEGRHE